MNSHNCRCSPKNYTELYEIFPNIQSKSPEFISNIGTIFKKFLENFINDLTVTYIGMYFEITFYGTLKDLPREVNLNIDNTIYKFVIL